MTPVKKIQALFLAVFASAILSGCTASYKQDFLQDRKSMSSQASILIVTPRNGFYETIHYPTSGKEVVQVLVNELKRYSTHISVIPNTVTINQIQEQYLQDIDYVFIPEILHWEDRATGWSFRPDRIEVRFDIFDKQRQLVNSVNIKGRSASLVWVQKTPRSLLPKPIRLLLRDLFQIM